MQRWKNEKAFQQSVVSAAEKLGWMHYHTHDSRRSVAGFPDLVLIHPKRGSVWFVELKMPKGRLSKHQIHWLNNLKACKQGVWLWRPEHWDDILGLLAFQTNIADVQHMMYR